MAHTSLTETHRHQLLEIAQTSIEHGLRHQQPLLVEPMYYPVELQKEKASFVTLLRHDNLRGCIGTLTAFQPLISDVAQHAYAAAFEDPRFSPLQSHELEDLSIHISVLTPPQGIQFTSEEDLLQQLRPGVDGLILQDRWHRGTFLPSVWESLPNPRDFLQRLKQKAGLPADYWSNTLTIQRYTTISF
jgi:hypothetical protein